MVCRHSDSDGSEGDSDPFEIPEKFRDWKPTVDEEQWWCHRCLIIHEAEDVIYTTKPVVGRYGRVREVEVQCCPHCWGEEWRSFVRISTGLIPSFKG